MRGIERLTGVEISLGPRMSGTHRLLRIGLLAMLATTIVLFAFGSASIPSVMRFGQSARWVGLMAVCALSLAIGGLARPTRQAADFLRLITLAGALVGVAFLSTAWSMAPRLTVERSATLLLLFLTSAALAYAVSADAEIWPWVLVAILAGAVAVCLIGLLVLAFDRAHALQWAYPARVRYQGIGQNPNTVPMLAAVAFPVSLWWAVNAPRRAYRIGAVLACLLLFGTIAASASRGALVAAAAAAIVYGLLGYGSWVPRAAAVGLAAAMVVVALGVSKGMPYKPTPVGAGAGSGAGAGHGKGKGGGETSQPAALNLYFPGALYDELGRPKRSGETQQRTIFGSSGRVQAWLGAIHQGDARPVAGFGFGTEERVFADRYYTFQGSRPENSYVGIYLQLGLVGVVLLLAMWLVLARAMGRLLRANEEIGAACAGVVIAGLVLTVVQSYVYSVGNIAAISFWVAAFLLVVATRRAQSL